MNKHFSSKDCRKIRGRNGKENEINSELLNTKEDESQEKKDQNINKKDKKSNTKEKIIKTKKSNLLTWIKAIILLILKVVAQTP